MSKLTAEARRALPLGKFAEPAKRGYPVDTKNRARNALSRVSQYGTPEEKAIVRKKVHSVFPSIGKTTTKPHSGFRSVQAAIDKKMRIK